MYFTGIYWKMFVSMFVGFFNILLVSFRICDKYGKYFSIVIDYMVIIDIKIQESNGKYRSAWVR